jgi:lincosamide nucleotidyltransferase A/C/D/E
VTISGTGDEMVCTEDVISIYGSLLANNIQVWLTGGWGIDALLREQTRHHKDLDIILRLEDVVQMRELLGHEGYCLKELWSENSWVVDSYGTETPTAFVLQDSEEREVDAHAMHLDDQGNGIPAWVNNEGLVFKREDLAWEGLIAGFAVRCLSPEMQVLCHAGYDLPKVQLHDLDLLHERFGVEYPDKSSHL